MLIVIATMCQALCWYYRKDCVGHKVCSGSSATPNEFFGQPNIKFNYNTFYGAYGKYKISAYKPSSAIVIQGIRKNKELGGEEKVSI